MLWILAACFALVVAGLRIVIRRGGMHVWWVFYTSSLVAGALGLALFATEVTVNTSLGVPNIGFLLAHLCFIAAAGLTQMFIHTIRHETPSSPAMVWQGVLALGVGLALVALWLAAPIHTINASYRQLPIDVDLVLYNWVLAIYYGGVLLNCAVATYRLRGQTPRSDRPRRIALTVNTVAAGIALVAAVLMVVNVQLAFVGQRWWSDLLYGAAHPLIPLAFIGFVVGATLFAVGPMLQERRRARDLMATLSPVWVRLRELHPVIELDASSSRVSLQVRAQRLLIEIADGLQLLPVTVSQAGDPVLDVARALADPPLQGRSAATVLPTAANSEDEERMLVALAGAYADEVKAMRFGSAASGTVTSRRAG